MVCVFTVSVLSMFIFQIVILLSISDLDKNHAKQYLEYLQYVELEGLTMQRKRIFWPLWLCTFTYPNTVTMHWWAK